MEFNSIGYFQLDNLLQSRVPMILVLLEDVPLDTWYNSIVKMHLENISIRVEEAAAIKAVQEKNLPPHFAVVVLDIDESKSPRVVKSLEALGLLNAYYVQGGWQGITEERANPNR